MTIGDAARGALPLIARERAFDAVALACAAACGPATTEQVRARLRPALSPTAKGLTGLLRRIEALGPDERGRRLAGDVDRVGMTRWWLHVPDEREARLAALAGERAIDGEDLLDVLTRALDALTAVEAPTPPRTPVAEPTTSRPDERRTSLPIEAPTISITPEPRSPGPQETTPPVQPATDQQSAAAPEAPSASAPAPEAARSAAPNIHDLFRASEPALAPRPPARSFDELRERSRASLPGGAPELAHAADPWSKQ